MSSDVPRMESSWTSGPVCIFDVGAVLAQYNVHERWNGWLCPWFDPLAAENMLQAIEDSFGDDEEQRCMYGIDWEWRDDGALVLCDRQYQIEYPEHFEPDVLLPDVDGLYPLGSHAWTWSAVDVEHFAWNWDPVDPDWWTRNAADNRWP